MKKLLVLFALAVLGVTAGIALGAGSGTVTVTNCATTNAPTHTVAVDTNSYTFGGEPVSVCATATATAQTVTVTTTVGTTTAPPPPSYLFDDEFNGAVGSKPSTTLWGAKTSSNAIRTWNGWSNVSEDGSGNLVITAAKNSSGIWLSGFISGKVAYSGPRHYEVRAKVPCGYGTWSGLWEWGAPYGGAPSLENDVAEQLGREPTAYHTTLHYWDSSGADHSSGLSVGAGVTLCNSFHTYAANVYADHVDFYLDGGLVSTRTAASVGLADLTQWSEVANLSLDMGGSWACPSSDTADCTSSYSPKMPGPVSMLVDYIRISAL